MSSGIVYLVGAGPGDPALLTRRGEDLLRRAEVVVYDGLVNPVLLDLAPHDCERLYAGKKHARAGAALGQDEINALIVEQALAGRRVVRLKGGDPFVFGRGAEECEALCAAGVPFEVVPGVTSATAVGAYAGIPLTARKIASTVVFATGHEAAGKPDSDVDWESLARAGTVVLFMALRTAGECVERLIAAGKPADTPAAAVYWGTTASQRTVVAPLAQLPAAIDEAGLRPPVLLMIGPVVDLRPRLSWYERRPLFGARVLIARGVEQSRAFAHTVAELGAEPVVMPVTRLLGPDDAGRAAVAAAMGRLGAYDWVILTSANSVTRFFDELGARGLDARALGGARVACVGPATAAACAERGIRADVVPPRGDGEGVGRDVAEVAGEAIRGARVLFPRAAYGRDEAADILRAAGADVDIVPIYRTVATPADDPAIEVGLASLRRGRIDVAAFFAPSQARALFDILGAEAAGLVEACTTVAAIGRTTAAALRELGVRTDVISSSPDPLVMAGEIAEHFHQARES